MPFCHEIDMNGKTTIAVSKSIRDQLASIGNKDSTFDEIVQQLIKRWRDEN